MDKNFIEEYVPINGIQQYFLHVPRDSKDVLLMLHGGPGLSNSYIAYYQQPYVDFCNMVYYDQRGAGKTQIRNQTRAGDLSFSLLMEDLRQTIAYLKEKYETDRIFLAGHSWGSVLGTQYALAHPGDMKAYIGYGQGVPGRAQDRHYYEFVKNKVMNGGKGEEIAMIQQVEENFPHVSREDYFAQYNMIAELSFSGGYDYMAEDISEIYANSPTWTETDTQVSQQVEKLNEKLYAQVLFDWQTKGTKYAVPIYYILGRHDEMTSSTIAANYFKTIEAPQKALYWIEEAGHLLDTDKPAAFFETVKEIILSC